MRQFLQAWADKLPEQQFWSAIPRFRQRRLARLVVTNGHILDNIGRYHPGVTYAEERKLYRNLGNGKFADVTSSQDPAFRAPRVGRGLAVGDYDNDGWLDLLVSNNGENAQLFRNAGGSEPAAQKNHWLGVRLIGTKSNRDGIGSALKITAGDLVSHDQAKGGMSYCSAQDREYILGWDNTPKSTPWNHLAERRARSPQGCSGGSVRND